MISDCKIVLNPDRRIIIRIHFHVRTVRQKKTLFHKASEKSFEIFSVCNFVAGSFTHTHIFHFHPNIMYIRYLIPSHILVILKYMCLYFIYYVYIYLQRNKNLSYMVEYYGCDIIIICTRLAFFCYTYVTYLLDIDREMKMKITTKFVYFHLFSAFMTFCYIIYVV